MKPYFLKTFELSYRACDASKTVADIELRHFSAMYLTNVGKVDIHFNALTYPKFVVGKAHLAVVKARV